MELRLRYDLRAPGFGAPQADLIQTCLEQLEWADRNGFALVDLQEHHGSEDGYNPAPLVLAAAIAARTTNIRIRISALVLPLYDPVRAAEEVALVDQISRGRLDVIVAAGYLAREFDMFGKDVANRVEDQVRGIEVLKKAWTGEPFDFNGKRIRVTPTPYQKPWPTLILAGSTRQAALRAARVADAFEPMSPEFNDTYREECARLGKQPAVDERPWLPAQFLHVTHDVDQAWEAITPHAFHEMNSYGAWLEESGMATENGYHRLSDPAGVRTSGLYIVVRPEKLVGRLLAADPHTVVYLHPLMGGLSPEISWGSLHLLQEQVLPVLREEGLLVSSASDNGVRSASRRRP